MNMINEMLKERDMMKSKESFVLVGIDEFEEVGEKLYKIGEFNNKKEAEHAMMKRKDNVFILEPINDEPGVKADKEEGIDDYFKKVKKELLDKYERENR